jgi:hypothetical protein
VASTIVQLLVWDIPQMILQSFNNNLNNNWTWLTGGSIAISILMGMA